MNNRFQVTLIVIFTLSTFENIDVMLIGSSFELVWCWYSHIQPLAAVVLGNFVHCVL